MEIKVNGIQFHQISRIHYGAARMSVRLGNAFDLSGAEIFKSSSINGLSMKKPTFHRTSLNALLDDYIRDILIKYFSVRQEMIDFLDKSNPGERLRPSPFFKPEEWNGGSLILNINHVKITNIQCERKSFPVTASIYFGNYFMFSKVPIYDAIREEYLKIEFIKSLEANRVMDFILEDDQVKREITRAVEVGQENDDCKTFICEDKRIKEERTDYGLLANAPLIFKE